MYKTRLTNKFPLQSFLQLYFFKKQLEDAEKKMHEDFYSYTLEENSKNLTVFDEALSLMRRLEKNVMKEINDFIFMEIKAKSKFYCNDRY